MGILEGLIDGMGRALIRAEHEKEKEKKRAELRKNSIDVEYRVLSDK